MKKGTKIAIAIGAGLAIGVGAWYAYSQYNKRKEASRLSGLDNSTDSTPSTTANLGTPITNAVPTTGQPKLNPLITQALSVASQPTESSFNGQEMVTRYQKPFWTVGG